MQASKGLSIALLITIVIAFVNKFPLTISLVLFMIGCGILIYIRALLQSISSPDDKEAIVSVLCMWCLILAHSIAIATVLPLAALIVTLSSLQKYLGYRLLGTNSNCIISFILHVIFWRTLLPEKKNSLRLWHEELHGLLRIASSHLHPLMRFTASLANLILSSRVLMSILAMTTLIPSSCSIRSFRPLSTSSIMM